jgi:hypothetical protein
MVVASLRLVLSPSEVPEQATSTLLRVVSASGEVPSQRSASRVLEFQCFVILVRYLLVSCLKLPFLFEFMYPILAYTI